MVREKQRGLLFHVVTPQPKGGYLFLNQGRYAETMRVGAQLFKVLSCLAAVCWTCRETHRGCRLPAWSTTSNTK
jgi:hypothetical protein